MKLPEFKRGGSKRALNGPGGGVKAPKFLTDLYADLRDRRLLPLVALLFVAIVAAPFLLSSKGESEETPEVAAIPAVVEGSAAEEGFTVTPAARELRKYGDRLGYRKARNPFSPGSSAGSAEPPKEGGKKSSKKGSGEEESGGTETSTETPSTTGSSTETSTPLGGESASNEESGNEPERVVVRPKNVVKTTLKAQVGVAAVVKAGFVGSKPKELELEAQARLPKKTPAIVYTGTSKKGGALFLMTGQVSEFSGDGHCVLGGATCQMVELKRKGTETFRIGYGDTRYKVRLLGYEPVIKEEVVEAEGKKIRVPSQEKQKGKQSGGGGKSNGNVGSEPSPRWLLR